MFPADWISRNISFSDGRAHSFNQSGRIELYSPHPVLYILTETEMNVMRKNAGKGSYIAPRNGHVARVMTMSGSGVHQKTKKAIRRADKVSLKKMAVQACPSP